MRQVGRGRERDVDRGYIYSELASHLSYCPIAVSGLT
jgi:hypothetical protein